MAKNNKQQPGGSRNIPAAEPPDLEQIGRFKEFMNLCGKLRGIIVRAADVDAGEAREKVLAEADAVLVEARTLGPQIYAKTAGDIDIKKLLKRDLPKEIGEARTKNTNDVESAARAAKIKADAAAAEAQLEAELEMEQRFADGTETDDDIRFMNAKREKEIREKLEEQKGEARKEMRKTEPVLDAATKQIVDGFLDDAVLNIEWLESTLIALHAQLVENEAVLTAKHINPESDPFIQFFKGHIHQLKSRIDKLRLGVAAKQQELEQQKAAKDAEAAQQQQAEPKGGKAKNSVQDRKADEPESLEELGLRFENTIAALSDRVPEVCSMPIGTQKELDAASEALAVLKREASDCVAEYKAKIGEPIIRPLFRDFKNPTDRDESGRAFTKLDNERAAFQSGFLGHRDKNVLGRYQERTQELSARRRKLNDVRRAEEAAQQAADTAAQESRRTELEAKWEAEFPAFELRVAKISNAYFDVLRISGKDGTTKRKDALEAVKKMLEDAREPWLAMRDGAPRPRSKEEEGLEKNNLVFNTRRKLEFMSSEVEKEINIVKTRGGLSSDKLINDWIGSTVLVSQLWNPDSSIEDRGAFLVEYLKDNILEGTSEFERMIPESARANFSKVLRNSGVIRDIQENVRADRRFAQQEEERLRAELSCSLLDLLRGRIDQEFDAARERLRAASFWKQKVSEKNSDRLLRFGAEMPDEELAKFVTDIPAFRAAVAPFALARAAARKCEDDMLMVKEAEGNLDVDAIRAMLGEWKEKDDRRNELQREALFSEGWGDIPKKKRRGMIRGFFEGNTRILKKVADPAFSAVVAWANAQQLAFVTRDFVRVVLEKNPDAAAVLSDELPKGFLKSSESDAADQGDSEPVADTSVGGDAGGDAGVSDPDADPDAEEAARVAGLAALAARRGKAAAAPVADPVVVAVLDPAIEAARIAAEAEQRKEIIRTARKETIRDHKDLIKTRLFSDLFFQDPKGSTRGTIGSILSALLLRIQKKGEMARLGNSDSYLHQDRIDDFNYVIDFVDLHDFERRLASVVAKYPVMIPAPVMNIPPAPVVAPPAAPHVSIHHPPLNLPPLPPAPPVAPPAPRVLPPAPPVRPVTARPVVARPPAPVIESVPVAAPSAPRVEVTPVQPVAAVSEPIISSNPGEQPRPESAPVVPPSQEFVSLGADPFERFFGPSRASTSRTEIVPAPRSSVIPAQAGIQSRQESTRRVSVIENTPVPQNPAELRVSGWAKSIRNFFGGGEAADIAVREATGMPSDRTRAGEAPSNTEVAYRTLGSVLSVVGSVFGFKAFGDVPRYLSQSFCTTNERALLEADILNAMETNFSAKQRAGNDPEASLRANREAAQRTDRAIATSAYLTDAQKVEMRARVADLETRYSERTRENVAKHSTELANVLENAVQNRVTGWGAAKETANSALRAMAFVDVPVGAVRGVTYGVMAFRERFETAATRNPDASFVAKTASVFRDTWNETWGKLTKQTNNFRERVTNVGDAMATIATAVGMASVTVGALEEALPGLRLASADVSSGIANLIAEGRQRLQEMVDKVLPTYERLAKRA